MEKESVERARTTRSMVGIGERKSTNAATLPTQPMIDIAVGSSGHVPQERMVLRVSSQMREIDESKSNSKILREAISKT